MSICRDKQIRGFFLFLTFFAVLLFGLGNPSKPVYIQTVWGVGYRFNKNLSSGL